MSKHILKHKYIGGVQHHTEHELTVKGVHYDSFNCDRVMILFVHSLFAFSLSESTVSLCLRGTDQNGNYSPQIISFHKNRLPLVIELLAGEEPTAKYNRKALLDVQKRLKKVEEN